MSGTSPRPAPLGAPYRRLWTSSSLSNLADGVFAVALPLVAARLTRSPVLVSGVTVALTLPWLLFALHAGALADRLDRRRTMLTANTARAGLLSMLVVAAATDVVSIWGLYVAALGIGVAETVYDTSAQSIVPQLVGRDQLARANGRLFGAQVTANEFVGPPLGGFLVTASVTAALATPVALWAAAVGTLALVAGSFRIPRAQPTTLRADIVAGLRFLWRHRLLRTLAVMVGVFNFGSNAMLAILVLHAVGPTSAMGLSEPAYGTLLTTIAAGSLLGSFVAEPIERRLGRARTLAVAIIGGAVAVGAPAVTVRPPALGAAFLVGGASIIVWNVITVSLRQRITPDRLLGRVNSCYRLVGWGTRPVGAAAGGLLAEVLGLQPVFVLMALLLVAMLTGMTIVTDEAMAAAERHARS